MKSVVHLITTIARGGAENQLKVVVREQVRSGFKVKVIYLKDFPELRQELQNSGAEVINIGNAPDGMNINKDVGSTHPQALQRKVRELRADIGIALDGDADRVLIVDEKARLLMAIRLWR